MNYAYLPAGQVSSVESVAGTVSYGYDAAERLTQINTPAGSFQYAYDANGRVAAVNGGVKASYGYDALGRVASIAWKNTAGKALRNFAYAYDAAGMITQKVTTASGQATTENYAYDSLNRLTSESSLTSAFSVRSVANYSYDLSGNRTSKQVGDASGTLATVNYALGLGNRLANWQVAETNPAARLDVAGFSSEPIGTDDRFGQLWVAAGSTNRPAVAGTNFWAYGVAVNSGTQQVVAAIRDAAGNVGRATNSVVVNVVTGADYGYNAAGCMTNISYSGTGFSKNLGLTWNGQYQLTEVMTNGVSVERNGFDALGRRIWAADGLTTNYMVYDGVHVSAEVDCNGGLLRTYTHGPGMDNWLAMTVYTGATTKTYFYLTDHLGTVNAVADENGTIVESYRYDAWGRVLGVYDRNGKPLTESAIGNRILWQGREYSWKTGLYFFRVRWYDPVTGRWLSNDPIGISGGLNQYVFCANNPINFRDPLGLCDDNKEALLHSVKTTSKVNTWIGVAGVVVCFIPPVAEFGPVIIGTSGVSGLGLGAADSGLSGSPLPFGTALLSYLGGNGASALATGLKASRAWSETAGLFMSTAIDAAGGAIQNGAGQQQQSNPYQQYQYMIPPSVWSNPNNPFPH
ncbi:MAG: hypothetical protein EPN23_01550 [Verrucomicrobia bacterium]|nr:MAG: hypothetical protein EPN23_01550 [Verrucomicrobiota bacterium]